MPAELRHEVLQTAIRDLSANTAGNGSGAGGDGGDGLTCEHGTVSGGDPAKGTAHKADRAADTHAGAAAYHGVAHIAVGAEAIGKAGRETGCSTCCLTHCTRGIAGAAEDAARRTDPAAKAAHNTGGHQHLHPHAGAGLCDAEPHGGQIAVKALGALEEGESAEEPEEDAAFAVRQRTSVSDKLSHGRIESPEEPDVHNEQQQLRSDHPAPGFED